MRPEGALPAPGLPHHSRGRSPGGRLFRNFPKVEGDGGANSCLLAAAGPREGRSKMSLLTDLLVQVVAGAVGGNAAGRASKKVDLGPLGNTISGALGGGIGGQILSALLPALATTAANAGQGFDIAAFLGQAAGGGVTGAIVTAAVGLLKKRLFGNGGVRSIT